MYALAVQKDFIASHYLIGGDWGPENQLHAHHYVVEITLEGNRLDEHGYLVDIVDVEDHLGRLINYFKDKTLNDLEEFKGLNPSIEHFSRIISKAVSDGIRAANLTAITVKIWESDIAWSSYRQILSDPKNENRAYTV